MRVDHTVGRQIAHVRGSTGAEQALSDHLKGVARRCAQAAQKLGLAEAGELIGLVHDLGKHSEAFQTYLRTVTGKDDPDGDDGAFCQRGQVDHSTAGAQLVWQELGKRGRLERVVGQALAICVASHHSGLIDCIATDPVTGPRDEFMRRMSKDSARTHLDEAFGKLDQEVRGRVADLLRSESLPEPFILLVREILSSPPREDLITHFKAGLLLRFLFSCLIDADREDTADFEHPRAADERPRGKFGEWGILVRRLEEDLAARVSTRPIDGMRFEISRHCLQASGRPRGLFTLTVPTGGGKTLASLRFALHHAKLNDLDRVIYVVPFTTIIDQNADVARRILEPPDRPGERGRVVLEHHSNLDPLRHGWKNKVLSDNWDAPVVYTTTVQFLEAILGGGTRGVRRMHQLTRAVIIFDEIQTLPVKCIHLFNNAINFLTDHCGSTVVLCTATQPLLGRVDARKGAAKLGPESEIVPDVTGTFAALRRVEIRDDRRATGWTDEDVASLARLEADSTGACLVVVNTKREARQLFAALAGNEPRLYHLSTSMCPAHRRSSLQQIREHLDRANRLICISTQLIEAGVDVDFGSVIRYAAGMDSIAQAAGRCNRHGSRPTGVVHVVNPAEERLSSLKDIEIAKLQTERVLDDFRDDPGRFDRDLLSPKTMEWFYENYFFARSEEMGYPIGDEKHAREDTLLGMLSANGQAMSGMVRRPDMFFRQSFKTANDAFQAIDAPTTGVVVPYGRSGRDLISRLCAACDVQDYRRLLRAAQQFSVNVYDHELRKLDEGRAVHQIQRETPVLFLDERHYSETFGLSVEPVSAGEFLYVDRAQKCD